MLYVELALECGNPSSLRSATHGHWTGKKVAALP